jgi:DNA-binding response OmpR family regulator
MQKVPAILIVDDDPDIGNMLKMMLEFKGYRVDLLNRADETEKVLGNGQFDLVILDMLIAGINGTYVCTQIRQHPRLCSIPVLMISALPDARKGCIDAGATEFISKPFEMNELLTKIKMLI